jgi:hypothetical protein
LKRNRHKLKIFYSLSKNTRENGLVVRTSLDEFDKSDSYLFLSKKLKGKEREGGKAKKMYGRKKKKQGGINNTGGGIFFNTTKKKKAEIFESEI